MRDLGFSEKMVDRMKFGEVTDILLGITERKEQKDEEPVLGIAAMKELG